MAFRIYDEYELEQFMNKGLIPEPIVVSKGTGYSIVNYTFVRGEFINVLSAANQDYHLINENVDWKYLSEVKFEIEGDFTYGGATRAIFSKGAYGSGGTGLVYINKINSTKATIYRSELSAGSEVATEFDLLDGVQKVRVENLKVYVNDIEVLSLSELTVDLVQGILLATIGKLSYGSLWYGVSLYRYSFDGEEFANNEPSGPTVYGDSGTTATRNTSSLDPDYIDDVMIQPYII